MSDSSPAPVPEPWPALDLYERRVLGVLIEKAKTTPDAYPLSINALVTGCNQKSNRDPVLNVNDGQVEETLESLQKRMYVIRITGGSRIERWRHNLYEAWRVEKVELAILGELLLRGPQTEGELRGRASRMEPIDDLEMLRKTLIPMRDRKLIVYLTPEERRGTVLSHGFHGEEETARLRSRSARSDDVADAAPVAAATRNPSGLEPRLAQIEQEIEGLKNALAQLQATASQLTGRVDEIAKGLGL
jgi:uncharacterized protein